MVLSERTLEELRKIINGDGTDDFRSGPQLVEFFNDLGFNDRYGQGFPSRWIYTDSKLKAINGTPELDKCIKKTFVVINFISRIDYLDSLIEGFNKYLAFDKWKIIRDNENIKFVKLDKIIIPPSNNTNVMNEGDFLALKFEVSLSRLKLEDSLIMVLEYRMREVENCLQYGCYLSCVILTGSIMEGILLGYAMKNPKKFNFAIAAPKTKNGNIKKFYEWSLNDLITVATEIDFIKEDVKKFSHTVRDFRNYIHPYEQMSSRFYPDEHTAAICIQVMRALISQLSKKEDKLSEALAK